MNLRNAARALGGEPIKADAVLCPGPGHSKRDRSLKVVFTPQGIRVHSFAGDDWRVCKDYVQQLLGEPVQCGGAAPQRQPSERLDVHSPTALMLWDDARPISGTPAEDYLEHRGLAYEGSALRWHPSCPFGVGERRPCMLGLVRNIVSNTPQAIHRTAIDPGGEKTGRKALGPLIGGAIKLSDDEGVERVLAFGEGIETTLSIQRLPDLASMPIGATVSAHGVASFPALPGLECVWIAVDNDASKAGEKAAHVAGSRLISSEIEVILLYPVRIGADLNDVVVSG